MLNLVSLEKKYKDHIVFSNMNIEFTKGNLYILMGANGSGKSTILKLVAGIIYKTDGKIIKDGIQGDVILMMVLKLHLKQLKMLNIGMKNLQKLVLLKQVLNLVQLVQMWEIELEIHYWVLLQDH